MIIKVWQLWHFINFTVALLNNSQIAYILKLIIKLSATINEQQHNEHACIIIRPIVEEER